jgi:hypothetical protein
MESFSETENPEVGRQLINYGLRNKFEWRLKAKKIYQFREMNKDRCHNLFWPVNFIYLNIWMSFYQKLFVR